MSVVAPSGTFTWIVGSTHVYVPNGVTVSSSCVNPAGGGVMITQWNGTYTQHTIPNVPYYTLPWPSQPVGQVYYPTTPITQAKSADELQDGELILALVARGYAVWKPNPEGK